MAVLGDWNWYLPRWLEWLPRIGSEGDAAPPVEPPQAEEPVEPPKPAPVPV